VDPDLELRERGWGGEAFLPSAFFFSQNKGGGPGPLGLSPRSATAKLSRRKK